MRSEYISSFAASGLKSPVASQRERYCLLLAYKQMVVLFATRAGAAFAYRPCTGCISVSISLHHKSLCFVCSHLASRPQGRRRLAQ
ncbi:hypothetical protein C2845_PM11G27840 [Panicum miliaceum]|uniref:Uncharacterized protein n=1 Tax=Panicum miliaceum TaxID=4540 RepID=A0A3L6RVX6_PANMI|nr:hypothetical protein C2845_PM11G27840 [Panicum miliaceum]